MESGAIEYTLVTGRNYSWFIANVGEGVPAALVSFIFDVRMKVLLGKKFDIKIIVVHQ